MTDPDDLEDLTTSLSRLGRLLASRQTRRRANAAAKVDVSQQGTVLLATLLREGRQQMAELASASLMDLGAVSRQIRLLELSGAVRRLDDASDSRVVLVELTAKGRRMAEALYGVSIGALENTMAGWSEADRKRFTRLLRRFVDDLMESSLPPSKR